MDFDFSDDAKALRDQARRFFAEKAGPAVARAAMDGADVSALWREIVDLGWTAARVPEDHGGVGMTAEAACVLAEEAGRALAPVPAGAGARRDRGADRARYRGAAGEVAAGHRRWLKRRGRGVGRGDSRSPAVAATRFADGTLTGAKSPVADLAAKNLGATLAIVSAAGPDGVQLYLVDLAGPASRSRRSRRSTSSGPMVN